MVETKEWVLQASDRCDGPSCLAQAYVKAIGVSGELFFCGHHYNKFSGPKLEAFAYEVIDERERLIENRLQGED
jgi:hypothetical protein